MTIKKSPRLGTDNRDDLGMRDRVELGTGDRDPVGTEPERRWTTNKTI
jgi:hypothetical protein